MNKPTQTIIITRDAKSGGVTQECFDAIQEALYSNGIKFEGKQAFLGGRCLRFPCVWSAANMRGADYAWETVAHVINTSSEFRI